MTSLNRTRASKPFGRGARLTGLGQTSSSKIVLSRHIGMWWVFFSPHAWAPSENTVKMCRSKFVACPICLTGFCELL